MAKQYHYVVMFDEDTKEWSIEWDTTDIMLEQVEGTIFDKDTTEWTTCQEDENTENAYRETSDVLADILKDYNALRNEE